MTQTIRSSAEKFDSARACEYEEQSRIALAGYEACHELTACMLVSALGKQAEVLVAGAGGTALEIRTIAKARPYWRFTAVDPSASMLDLAKARLEEFDFLNRVEARLGYVDDLPARPDFDAATLIGVLHHLPGEDAKLAILQSIAMRLKPDAPLILACNYRAYAGEPVLFAAWAERWRMAGVTEAEVQIKLGRILQGADPPPSEEAIAALLKTSGFAPPTRFFSSLFWGAWIARRAADAL